MQADKTLMIQHECLAHISFNLYILKSLVEVSFESAGIWNLGQLEAISLSLLSSSPRQDPCIYISLLGTNRSLRSRREVGRQCAVDYKYARQSASSGNCQQDIKVINP